MADPVYFVGIEFASGSFTEITDDVMRMSISRTLASPIETLRPGTANFILDNFDGRYSPDNGTSPYAGLMRPQLPIKVEASYSALSYQLFTGTIDEWSPTPDLNAPRQTVLQCRDNIKRLLDQSVATSLFINYNIGSAFVEVLSQSNVSSYSVDTIADDQPFIWFRDIKFTEAIDRLMEEGFFFSYVGGDGTFNVKDRYFDLEQSVTASLQEFANLEYTLNDDQVYNDILVEGVPREQDASTRSLAYITDSILIQASSSITFFLEYIDPDNFEPVPAINLVTPVNSTDYQIFQNSDGTGSEYTSTASASVTFFGQTAKNIVFNGTGSDAWLTRYGIRGVPIHRRARITAKSEDSSSQALYGNKTFRLSNELLGRRAHINDYATFLLDRYKNPEPDISAAVVNVFPETLALNVADKVVLIDSHTGITSQYVVQSILHDIDMQSGLRHQLNIEVYRFRDSDVLILDDPTFGVLDSRKLGF